MNSFNQVRSKAYSSVYWRSKSVSRYIHSEAIGVLAQFDMRPLIDDKAKIVVSLTTHGSRLLKVHQTIETIGLGQTRPSRIILWVGESDYCRLPSYLRRLERRGLEIRRTLDYGPHTKYYPLVTMRDLDGCQIVTADDDTLYPKDWLAALAAPDPDEVILAHRCHWLRTGDGFVLPYSAWGYEEGRTLRSFRNVATGVSGVAYPPGFMSELRMWGDTFMTTARTADDLWLHSRAVLIGVRTAQISPQAQLFPERPGTRTSGLAETNNGDGMNDVYVEVLYENLFEPISREETGSL